MSPADAPSRAEAPGRRRLGAERFKRIWLMVEQIARCPGRSRKQLAAEFTLSERQIQSDLNVVRQDMRLPLVRRQGYRFQADEEAAGTPFSLAEAQLLAMLLRRAARDPSLPSDRMQALLAKLPHLLPPHLRPLVAKTLEAVTLNRSDRQHEVLAVLAEALLRKTYVQLHYPAGEPVSSILEPIVQPEVLFPYLHSWYLIGLCRQRRRTMVFELDNVLAVTQATNL